MLSLFVCEVVGLVSAGVVGDVAFAVSDGEVTGGGRVGCGAGRTSAATGVGASVTLGSTEANLGLENGSEGCAEGAFNDPKKSTVGGQHRKQ